MSKILDIQELLAFAKALMREHRRMQLYTSVYHSIVAQDQIMQPEVFAQLALRHFDATFPP